MNLYSNEWDVFIKKVFPDVPVETIKETPLQGGRSKAKIYKIVVNEKSYVLRFNTENSSDNRKAEFFMQMEAAKVNIAPKVYYSSDDASIVLMDYIDKLPMTLNIVKSNETLKKVAKSLSLVHKLPNNPIVTSSLFERLHSLYQSLVDQKIIITELTDSIDSLLKMKDELDNFKISPVTIHGDVNPCNIFLDQDKIILIDWSATGKEDPFFDICSFAMCHNLSSEEEIALLSYYLEHIPMNDEISRYKLIKKMNYIYFAIELLFIAYNQASEEHYQLNFKNSKNDWKYYIQEFAKRDNQLSPQYFYDFGLCALKIFKLLNGTTN